MVVWSKSQVRLDAHIPLHQVISSNPLKGQLSDILPDGRNHQRDEILQNDMMR